jgi:predicted ATPase
MAEQLLRAWEDWIGSASRAQPVALIFDDRHWGDLPTVRFVDSALRRFSDHPLFVLALGRAEMHEAFPQLWAERGAIQLHLRKLTRRECEQLVQQSFPSHGDPPHLDRLIEHADGNPFYLEELIRSAAEGNRELPSSFLAMLQLRIAALPHEARPLLRAGSIF